MSALRGETPPSDEGCSVCWRLRHEGTVTRDDPHCPVLHGNPICAALRVAVPPSGEAPSPDAVAKAADYLNWFIDFEPGTSARPQREKAHSAIGVILRAAALRGEPPSREGAPCPTCGVTVHGTTTRTPLVIDESRLAPTNEEERSDG